jgi:iron complex outermembrane receptor protein
MSARWKPAAQWLLAGHLSYTDARYDQLVEVVGTNTVSRQGNTPSNTPDWVTGLTTTWQPSAALSLALDWRHVGQRYANTANTVWDGAYDLFGLSASWQWSRQLSLRARVNNLADKSFAATAGTNLVYLGAPRTWQLSADWQF